MKRLSFFNKIVLAVNAFFALLLLLACAGPYVSAIHFPFLSFLSIVVPILVVCTFLFFCYWIWMRKKALFFSFSVLVFGYIVLGSFIAFRLPQDIFKDEELKVMSFNVRSFAKYDKVKMPLAFENTKVLIAEQDPDIICFQEIDYLKLKEFEAYPYQYVKYINSRHKSILGILSKYPILESDILNFPKTTNSGAYADIVYKKDTIRVYNLHLESFRLIPTPEAIAEENSGRLIKRLSHSFKKQGEQAMIVQTHKKNSPYKNIVCGDFNNTQFSNVYHSIKADMLDTFEEKGSGYGSTYNFIGFPLRIDFILADTDFKVMAHKNFDERLSDHFPVMASFSLNTQ